MTYGSASYVYSENGDLRLKIEPAGGGDGTDTTRYVYDAFGSLVSVTLPNGTLIEYLLDGNGLRIGRKVNGALTNKWIYSNDLRIVAETDSANNITSRFIYTTSENVPEYMVRGGIVYRIVTDHLGSVKQVVNTQTGTVVQQLNYDEYGGVLIDSNPAFSPFGFGGGLYDGRTKLVRYGARDYEPSNGKWLSKDPIGFQGGDLNLYRHTLGDPINHVDVDGRQLPFLVKWAIQRILGIVFGMKPDPHEREWEKRTALQNFYWHYPELAPRINLGDDSLRIPLSWVLASPDATLVAIGPPPIPPPPPPPPRFEQGR